MDFSKLPKLSETKPEPAAEAAPQRVVAYDQGAPRDLLVGGEIWVSILIGIVFIYLGARPLEYLFTRSHPEKFEQMWTFQDVDGSPLNYPQTIFFLPDLGILALGIVLIFDGLQMLVARSARFAIAALILTSAVTLLNVVAMVAGFQNGSGFQLLTFLAVILGGYTAIYQLNAVRQLRYFSQFKMNP